MYLSPLVGPLTGPQDWGVGMEHEGFTPQLCRYCGREVEDRGHPLIQEYSNWYSIWVHVPGGYTACDPQGGASSTRAEPEA